MLYSNYVFCELISLQSCEDKREAYVKWLTAAYFAFMEEGPLESI